MMTTANAHGTETKTRHSADRVGEILEAVAFLEDCVQAGLPHSLAIMGRMPDQECWIARSVEDIARGDYLWSGPDCASEIELFGLNVKGIGGTPAPERLATVNADLIRELCVQLDARVTDISATRGTEPPVGWAKCQDEQAFLSDLKRWCLRHANQRAEEGPALTDLHQEILVGYEDKGGLVGNKQIHAILEDRKFGRSEKTVNEAIKELEMHGLIERPSGRNGKRGRKGCRITHRGQRWLSRDTAEAATA